MSTVNVWKYGREVYLIGRSHKFRYLTDKERQAVITFIAGILETRPAIAQRLNLKYENAGKVLEKQNSYALLKMVQVIGRNLKVQFVTEEQKALCDTLIAAVVPRAEMGYKDYVGGKINNIGTGFFEEAVGERYYWDEQNEIYGWVRDHWVDILPENNKYVITEKILLDSQTGDTDDILLGYTDGDLNNIEWQEEGWSWHPENE